MADESGPAAIPGFTKLDSYLKKGVGLHGVYTGNQEEFEELLDIYESVEGELQLLIYTSLHETSVGTTIRQQLEDHQQILLANRRELRSQWPRNTRKYFQMSRCKRDSIALEKHRAALHSFQKFYDTTLRPLLERSPETVREGKRFLKKKYDVFESSSASSLELDSYGACYNVPPNPPRLTLDYSTTDTCEGKLKAAILESLKCRSKIVGVLIMGPGGVGKTCALRGLADDEQIIERFSGGTLYIQLENDSYPSDAINEIAKCVQRTGGKRLAETIRARHTAEEASETAEKWFAQHQCLLLLDDVWEMKQLRVLGSMLNDESLLVCTSKAKAMDNVADKTVIFETRNFELSRSMLMNHANIGSYEDLGSTTKEAVERILDICQGLPLALGIAGNTVRRYFEDGEKMQNAWIDYYHDLRENEELDLAGDTTVLRSVWRVVPTALKVLDSGSGMGRKFTEMFRGLCVLQKQQTVSSQMLQKLWSVESLQHARQIAELFESVSLISMVRQKENEFSISVHDFIVDVATQMNSESERIGWFRSLIDNYIPRGQSGTFEAEVNTPADKRLLRVDDADKVEPDAVRAMELYERAIEEGGDVEDIFALGRLLEHGADGVARDAVRAMALYERAIEKGGYVEAIFALGRLLEHGADGVEQDTVRAKQLYERAIEDGGDCKARFDAMFELGSLLENGARGVPKDALRSKELYERAIVGGEHASAMFYLGRLLVRGAPSIATDNTRAADLFTMAIKKEEHTEAMLSLGALLADGAEGVNPDEEQAVELFERAITQAEDVDNMLFIATLLQARSDDQAQDLKRTIKVLLLETHGNSYPFTSSQLTAYLAVAHIPAFRVAAKNQIGYLQQKALHEQESGTGHSSSTSKMQRTNHIIKVLAPFIGGWRLDLITAVIAQDTRGIIGKNELHRGNVGYPNGNESSSAFPDGGGPYEKLRILFHKLGIAEEQESTVANAGEFQMVLHRLVTTTTWEEFHKLDDRAAITYADFHQILDGVLTGKITNCLLDCTENSQLQTYAISANVAGSPIQLGVRFMGGDAYVEYNGYFRRIASFESKTDADMARLHVDGPWLVGKGNIIGTMHDIGPVEVAGPRSLTQLAYELSSDSCSPSARTIASWRKRFALRLSTSDLWFRWKKVYTRCEVLRCRGGQMVVDTTVLTFGRTIGASISMEPALELAQEETVTEALGEIVCFNGVKALVGAKVVPEALRGITDDEVARALYISSSWFSIKGPKALPGRDCAWGNRDIRRPEAEVVEWIPTTRELMMSGWKLYPEAVTPTGRNWGPLRTAPNNGMGMDHDGPQRCHLSPNNCIGPVELHFSLLMRCIWGSGQ